MRFAGSAHLFRDAHESARICSVAEVDLKDPKLHLQRIARGPDPTGRLWQTTLLQPTKIAARREI